VVERRVCGDATIAAVDLEREWVVVVVLLISIFFVVRDFSRTLKGPVEDVECYVGSQMRRNVIRELRRRKMAQGGGEEEIATTFDSRM
jgi:hypothetical protein